MIETIEGFLPPNETVHIYPPDTVNKQDIDFGHGEVIKAGDMRLVQRKSTLGKDGVYNHQWLFNYTPSGFNGTVINSGFNEFDNPDLKG